MSWLLRLAPIVLLLAGGLAGDSQPTCHPPRSFHTDLRSLGAVKLEEPASADDRETLPPWLPDALTFADNSTLAVSFPILNPETVLSKRGDPKGGSYLFHTVVLNLDNGRVMAERTWGTAYDSDTLLSLGDRRFLVRSGGKLTIVSAEWQEESSYRLRDPDHTRIIVSPSGRTLFVVTKAADHEERIEVLAAATLARLHAFDIESVGLDAGSDSAFAYLLPAKNGYALFLLPFTALEKPSAPSLQPLYFTHGDGCIRPESVSDDRLVLTGYCDALPVIAADGMHRYLPLPSFYVGLVRTSREGHRFAVAIADAIVPVKREGRPDPLRVYETGELTAVCDLPLPLKLVAPFPRLDFALSSDGSLLAVLYGYDLSVYQLPPLLANAFPAAVTQVTGATPATVSAGSSAQPVAPATTLGPEGGKSSELSSGTEAHAPAVEVTASLLDLRNDAIQAWVRVSNRDTTDISLAPGKATLEIFSPGHKTLNALDPDKLARTIRTVGQVDADTEWKAGCDFRNPYANCGPAGAAADRIRQEAQATAADVKASALPTQVLKPGEQAQGAIFFTYQKKRGESVLRLPIGDQVFEFHFPPKKEK